MKPVELGEIGSDGAIVASDVLNFQKRTEPLSDPILNEAGEVIGQTVTNPGGGRRLQGGFDGKETLLGGLSWQGQMGYEIFTPQGEAIVGGDSGGGIFDALGRLVGSISGSSAPTGVAKGSSFRVSFDAMGIAWAKQMLAQIKNGPVSPPVGSPQPLSIAQTETGAPAALAQTPLPANGSNDLVPGFPPSGVKYLVQGQWLDHVPLNRNTVAINGQRVPPNATGYRLGQNGSVDWVGPNQNLNGNFASFGPATTAPAPVFGAAAPRIASMGYTAPTSSRAPVSFVNLKLNDPSLNVSASYRRQFAPELLVPSPSPVLASAAPLATAPSAFAPRAPAQLQASPPPQSFSSPIVQRYEQGMQYIGGHPRERFPAEMFRDIPAGGTGKLRLAYFGPRDPALERAYANEPVEIRWYPPGSPEAFHANLFGVQALGVDGLGRKITRYAFSPRMALQSLLQEELPLLKQYLQAKGR